MEKSNLLAADPASEKTVELTAEDLAGMSNEDVLIGAASALGTRESQQDAFAVLQDRARHFAAGIVCDGMGGLQGGEIASQTAVAYLRDSLTACMDSEDLRSDLYEMTWRANALVSELKTEANEPLRAGTTLVMAVIRDGDLHWISVGDSKIFLIRGTQMVSLTNSHNYAFMVEQQRHDSSFRFNPEARQDALVSYLGCGRLQYVDMNAQRFPLEDEDLILLCSDGLYKSLTEEQIRVLFLSESTDMSRAAEMLIAAAGMNAANSQDNTTVVVLKYKNELM